MLTTRGGRLPSRDHVLSPPESIARPEPRLWADIVAEARLAVPGEVSFSDVLSPEELKCVQARLDSWGAEFANLHKLETFDYVIAGVAGVLAGLADVFLVQVPKHPGFLGGPASEGGWLSNVLKDGFAKALPEDKVATLEAAYKVPYDPSTSNNLAKEVAGLGPRSHRLSSLGHDPVLGWIFGVRDILTGQFTAIGKDGRIVVQDVAGFEPSQLGVDMFAKIIEAFQKVGGHMASDVSTASGLPPPFFALLQFLQFGDFKGRNFAEISRIMYREGYDFRHFLAGGVCVALIEVIVRTAWLGRELYEGKSFIEALPIGDKPRLRTGLFLAHTVAAMVNAGKVTVTQNPLSISWSQWLAFFRYLMPQLHWTLLAKERERSTFIQSKLDDELVGIEREFAANFRTISADQAIL